MSLGDFHPRHVTVNRDGDVAIVALKANRHTDEDEVELVGRELFTLLDQYGTRKVVLSLANIEQIASALIGKLIAFHRKLHRASGQLVLCEPSAAVVTVFESSRLLDYFHIENERDAAIAAVK